MSDRAASTFAYRKGQAGGLDGLATLSRRTGKPLCLPDRGIDNGIATAFADGLIARFQANDPAFHGYRGSDAAIATRPSAGRLPATDARYRAAFG